MVVHAINVKVDIIVKIPPDMIVKQVIIAQQVHHHKQPVQRDINVQVIIWHLQHHVLVMIINHLLVRNTAIHVKLNQKIVGNLDLLLLVEVVEQRQLRVVIVSGTLDITGVLLMVLVLR